MSQALAALGDGMNAIVDETLNALADLAATNGVNLVFSSEQ